MKDKNNKKLSEVADVLFDNIPDYVLMIESLGVSEAYARQHFVTGFKSVVREFYTDLGKQTAAGMITQLAMENAPEEVKSQLQIVQGSEAAEVNRVIKNV